MLDTITKRIDNITKIAPEFLCEAPPAPHSMKIELSGRCNYACEFCAHGTREAQPTKDMPLDLYKQIAVDAFQSGVREIGVFFLGESLTAPDLAIEAVRFAKSIGYPYVFLTTNGSLASPEVVRGLMSAGLDSLKFSVNAADEAQFKQIMRVKPALFRRALENIRAAHAVREQGGFKTRLYASSIRYDGEQLVRMESLLNAHIRPYVDEHYYLPLYSMAMRSPEIEKKLGYKPQHGNSGRYDVKTGMPNRDPLPCWSAFTEAHVRVDGHMSLCCFGSDEHFDVGDLTKESFMSAWCSEKMRSLRRAQLRTKSEGPAALNGTACERCVAYAS
jgi:MoaA/NifB/PqqE/SkfB family radical SAM enzyme